MLDDHDRPSIETLELWKPEERFDRRSFHEIAEELKGTLLTAGRDLTRGLGRVAFTLSGGWDSRAILASLPREPQPEAITFMTRENREVATARDVARAAGIRQRLAVRHPEYFAELLPRSVELLGLELRANAHGLCVADNGLQDDYDIIIGGQLCDTLLKDHFLPKNVRERLRHRSVRERSIGLLSPRGAPSTRVDHDAAIRSALDDTIVEGIEQRRQERIEAVAKVRPITAVEWDQFWPASRQNDAGHNLGNSRLYASDSLYMHREIVSLAACLPQAIRFGGRLTRHVFREMYGELARIPVANTGVAPADGDRAERRVINRRRRTGRRENFRRLPDSLHPWNDVQTSWVDWARLQQESPVRQRMREEVRQSVPTGALDAVLSTSSEQILASYAPDLGPSFNLIIMQLALGLRLSNTNVVQAGMCTS